MRLASRSLEKSRATCDMLAKVADAAKLTPCETASAAGVLTSTTGVQLVVAAGAAGVQLISAEQLSAISSLKLAIDLNAVSPSGIAGVEVMDKAKDRSGLLCYGAVGVGGNKMKIHHACIRRLFESNDQRLETTAIFELGRSLS